MRNFIVPWLTLKNSAVTFNELIHRLWNIIRRTIYYFVIESLVLLSNIISYWHENRPKRHSCRSKIMIQELISFNRQYKCQWLMFESLSLFWEIFCGTRNIFFRWIFGREIIFFESFSFKLICNGLVKFSHFCLFIKLVIFILQYFNEWKYDKY